MAKNIIVGCKLPHGITLEHPIDPSKKVTLKGLNKTTIIGADYASTEVNSEFWTDWESFNKDFKPLKSGAIFVAKNETSLADAAKDFASVKTGLEPMRTDGKDERAGGVKSADKE